MGQQTLDENTRLATLEAYGIVDSSPDPRFDAILADLVEISGVPLAEIAFIASDTTWVKSFTSATYKAVPRAICFADRYIVGPVRTVVIPDVSLVDPEIPLLISGYIDTPVAAVAGVPICAPNGAAIGALVLFDSKPHDFTMMQVEALTRAARRVVELLESTRAAMELAGEQLLLPVSSAEAGADLIETALTDVGELGSLVDNSRAIVEEFVTDNLHRAGWWAAQVWWAEDDYLYPDPWILDAVAPEVLGRLRSRSGSVPIKVSGVDYPEPTLIDLEAAPWLGNLQNISQSGVRHLLVFDVAGAMSVALRIVFVVPEGLRAQPEVISALGTGARLLPRLLRQEQARGELLYRSTHDTLTGLLNRRGLDQVLAPLADTKASQTHAVMYLDLDHFKQVNDTHGHAIGDQLLKYVGTQVLKQVRPTDSVVRLGGDEFLVLAKNIGTQEAAYSLGKRVLNAVNTNFLSDSGVQLPIATSIGVAMWTSDGNFEETLRAADSLMYQAKQAGGSLAVEGLAGTATTESSPQVALNQFDVELVNTSCQLIESTLDGALVGLLITVESPLRSLGPEPLVRAITDAISESALEQPDRILLRFSNHFWHHPQLIPILFDILIEVYQEVVFSAIIDSALIGVEPTEVMLALAADSRIGIVMDGQGGAVSRYGLLDLLHPTGMSVPAEKLNYLATHQTPSRSLRAISAVTAALHMDFYCLDWDRESMNGLLAQAGIGFVSFKLHGSEK